MKKIFLNMVCQVQVQYLQQPLQEYSLYSRKIFSSEQFKSKSDELSEALSTADSSSSANENSSSGSNSTSVNAKGAGWGLSFEAGVSHSNSSSSSSAASQAAANEMATAFQNATSSASRISSTMEEEKGETKKFFDGWLQVIQRIKTIVTLNGETAEVVEELLFQSAPFENHLSTDQLQSLAEDFIKTYDDGTGEGIVIGPRCQATKRSVLEIAIPDDTSTGMHAIASPTALLAASGQLWNQPGTAGFK